MADGAAFGANMAEVYRFFQMHPEEVVLYLPESFEWLILASDVLNDPEIRTRDDGLRRTVISDFLITRGLPVVSLFFVACQRRGMMV